MTASADIEGKLFEFVVAELLDGDAGELTASTNLLALGVIDSLSMVSVRTFIERTYDLRLPHDLPPEEFASIAAMASMIQRLQAATPR